jgi:hypothetical protein
LLLHEIFTYHAASLKRLVFWLALLMLAITLVMQFWLQPYCSVACDRRASNALATRLYEALHFGMACLASFYPLP